jgi:chromosome segregation ATPase
MVRRSEVGNRYVYNKHIAPITAHGRNAKGEVVLTIKFQPERVDPTTGRVVSTGYTTLSEEEYELLESSSRTFTVYRDKHKLLVDYDDLPAEAKTPQEALLDAKSETRKAAAQISKLTSKITELETKLAEAVEERDALKTENDALKNAAQNGQQS